MATMTNALTSSRFGRRVLGSSIVKTIASPHSVERYVEIIDPLWAIEDVRAEVTEVEFKTSDSVTLTVRPNANWKGFRAGQFVRLSVEIDGVRRTRCYSPAGSQFRRDGRIELTVKVDPNGLVSRYLRDTAKPGMIVHLSQAQGEFFVPLPHPRRILLISGGSGITPVMSMLRTLCDKAYNGKITFLHYAFTENDVIYRHELDELKRLFPTLKIVRAYTDQRVGGDLHGYFSREHLLAADPHFAEAETFVCGPVPLMDAVRAIFSEEGLDAQLHVEQFAAPVRTVASDEVDGELSFAYSDKTVQNSGRTILEQAEDAGLTPEYGCRMGICFSCTKRKDSGVTRNVRTGELCSEDGKDIQICITAPVGDVSINL
jgi:stearoyl-CoA 9-desaturase NADPH oxidoreductase